MAFSTENFRVLVAQRLNEHKSERIGQAAFNVLAQIRPDLANRVRGTKNDPFYARKVDDKRFIGFVTFIEENW